MTDKNHSMAIVGGGASGFAAAIEAGRSASITRRHINAKLTDITVYESLPRACKKLSATGNGKCNLGNKNDGICNYFGDRDFAAGVFSAYGLESNLEFFKSMGLYTREKEGRLYPLSSQARDVSDILRFEAEKLGINVLTGIKIQSIVKNGGAFLLNEEYEADSVILASGGKAAKALGSDGSGFELAKSLGIAVTPVFPALTSLVLKDFPRSLKGIRANGAVKIISGGKILKETAGEIQYNENGISGIPAMDASRTVSERFCGNAADGISLIIDKIPCFTHDELYEILQQKKERYPDLPLSEILTGIIPKALCIEGVKSCGINPCKPLKSTTRYDLKALCENLKSSRYEIKKTGGFDAAQVTAGGLDTKEFSPATLEHSKVKKLYACGEALNVDGACGGYNLQWAWSSGRLAGHSAIEN
ncbi:MAG: aminoacetone oxidase family FAD-binding enzyme [Oscillospiraceae bacterium]|nr:aminoacetone oxidase family FAD-binding enzyme [Oscillospiraceae bacterium]